VDYGPPVSTLAGTFDQAGLHGVLRRLYSLGLPLVSVVWVKRDSDSVHRQRGTDGHKRCS
jgi:hypothetical protein